MQSLQWYNCVIVSVCHRKSRNFLDLLDDYSRGEKVNSQSKSLDMSDDIVSVGDKEYLFFKVPHKVSIVVWARL